MEAGFNIMVAVRLGNSGDTYYVIGDFWEIVARLKANRARFRFRSRRWRWPGSFSDLKNVMQPFSVAAVNLSEAQQLQLIYDRNYIHATQDWIKANTRPVQDSVEWWAATRLKDISRSQKQFKTHQERVNTALTAMSLSPNELERAQILALQQTQRLVKQYENRIAKWSQERDKARRREELVSRFEEEMGLSRADLLEVETSSPASRQALYEELAGLDWQRHEISELKAVARLLLRQSKKQHKDKNQNQLSEEANSAVTAKAS